jgi:hypothetical protein
MEDKNAKERYKRIPVYTKKHYGSPKSEPTAHKVRLLKEILLPIAIIAGCAVYFIYPAIRPKQAWETEKDINEWYIIGSHNLCEENLKKKLRDPQSYKRASNIKIIKDNGLEKEITWEFRARNGFGGMNVGEGACLIKKRMQWVLATIR